MLLQQYKDRLVPIKSVSTEWSGVFDKLIDLLKEEEIDIPSMESYLWNPTSEEQELDFIKAFINKIIRQLAPSNSNWFLYYRDIFSIVGEDEYNHHNGNLYSRIWRLRIKDRISILSEIKGDELYKNIDSLQEFMREDNKLIALLLKIKELFKVEIRA